MLASEAVIRAATAQTTESNATKTAAIAVPLTKQKTQGLVGRFVCQAANQTRVQLQGKSLFQLVFVRRSADSMRISVQSGRNAQRTLRK